MSEWWTYSLSDFLLFSPRTYYRLFELHNQAIWPGQILALILGAALLVLVWRGRRDNLRVACVILAGCWLWVAWAYLLERYDTINWAARYFAGAFAVQALLLLVIGLSGRGLLQRRPVDLPAPIALGVLAFSIFVQPLIGPLAGRPWLQAEIFGMAPDPTVIATLAVTLAAGGRAAALLMIVPLAWCAISGLTLWTMGAPDALLVPGLGLAALMLALLRRLLLRPPTLDSSSSRTRPASAAIRDPS